VVGEGAGGVAGGVGGLAESVERPGLAAPGADLADEGERPIEVLGGLFRLAEAGVNGAEVVQRDGFAGSIAELLEQVQGVLDMVGGRPVAA
jgi:hypothetical protein